MNITILDCYTDEPSGLGVPPYIGTYPRYIYGTLCEGNNVQYITIDDLRWLEKGKKETRLKSNEKTDIKTYNKTRSSDEIKGILEQTQKLIIVAGVHTPGKYLSAVPGTMQEIEKLTEKYKIEKVITGPAVFGSSLEGGRMARMPKIGFELFDFSYATLKKISAKGAEVVKQIPYELIAEIETGKGCTRSPGCSFCTEPLKNTLEFREKSDVLKEIKALYKQGIRHFRIGKQSCFYSLPYAADLLKEIRGKFSDIKTLHIDNVNPAKVIEDKDGKITTAIVDYCTSGNVASFGVESFDPVVIEANNLNSNPEMTLEAARLINSYGKERGENGLPKFLPGINILFGLKDESKETHSENMKWLKKILDDGLLIRRINIRQVNVYAGTPLFTSVKNKFVKKNKKYYWKWRKQIRQEIDYEMLKRTLPFGTVLKDVKMEIYDGKTTFGRQIGTYPIVVGVKGRVELGKYYTVKITDHMLRSVVGEII